jgi:hypothetical protein
MHSYRLVPKLGTRLYLSVKLLASQSLLRTEINDTPI